MIDSRETCITTIQQDTRPCISQRRALNIRGLKMDMQNTELNIESLEESHDFSEEERKQIFTEALKVCAEALIDLKKDVSDLRSNFSAFYQKD